MKVNLVSSYDQRSPLEHTFDVVQKLQGPEQVYSFLIYDQVLLVVILVLELRGLN